MTQLSDIEAQLSRTLDQATSSAHDALDRVTDAANHAANNLEKKSKYLLHTQREMTQSCRSFVERQPLTAVGVALAAGILLGWAIKER